MVDTNSNPENIDFVIPANDDATNSINIILDTVCEAIKEGVLERKMERVDDEKDAPAEGEAPKRRRTRKGDADKAAKAEPAQDPNTVHTPGAPISEEKAAEEAKADYQAAFAEDKLGEITPDAAAYDAKEVKADDAATEAKEKAEESK